MVIIITYIGEREKFSQWIYIKISSLMLWPIDPLSFNDLLYFCGNKHILIPNNVQRLAAFLLTKIMS